MKPRPRSAIENHRGRYAQFFRVRDLSLSRRLCNEFGKAGDRVNINLKIVLMYNPVS